MLGPNDLVLSSGAIDNPDVAELVRAARAGDYAGIALWPGAYLARASSASALGEMRARFDDAGLVVHDLDAAVVWAGPDDPGAPYYEEAPEREVYRMADALGAHGVNVLLHSGPNLDLECAAEAFAALCDRAAQHGLRAHLEFSRSRVPANLPSAARVVELTERANAGLMIDTWHVHWGDRGFGDLISVPGERVSGVQLSDAPAEEPQDFARATRHQRLLPGSGVVPLEEFLALLRTIDSRAPLCIEAFDTQRVARIGPVAYAREMADAARALLSRQPD